MRRMPTCPDVRICRPPRPYTRQADRRPNRVPWNRSDYPKDWAQVRAAKLIECGGQCECSGECGRPNHQERCQNRNGAAAWGTGSRVVLTMAHLNRSGGVCNCLPLCSKPEHLKMMCQGCHLSYDIEKHVQRSYQTRMRKKKVVEMEL